MTANCIQMKVHVYCLDKNYYTHFAIYYTYMYLYTLTNIIVENYQKMKKISQIQGQHILICMLTKI